MQRVQTRPAKRSRRARREKTEQYASLALFAASIAAGIAMGWATRSFFVGLLGGIAVGAGLLAVVGALEAVTDEAAEGVETALQKQVPARHLRAVVA